MKSFLKFTLTSTGLLLILIGVVGIVGITQAQEHLTRTVNVALSDAFGSAAVCEAITVDPAQRAIVLKGFSLKNPPGFREGDALTCETVRVVFDPVSIVTMRPVVETMQLEGTHLYYRYEVMDGTNFKRIAENMGRSSNDDTVEFVVRQLRCENAKLHLSTGLLPGASVPVNMALIDLKNLDEGKPVTTAKITSIFLRTVLKEAVTLKGLLSSRNEKEPTELESL